MTGTTAPITTTSSPVAHVMGVLMAAKITQMRNQNGMNALRLKSFDMTAFFKRDSLNRRRVRSSRPGLLINHCQLIYYVLSSFARENWRLLGQLLIENC